MIRDERWQRIKEIFTSVHSSAPAERAGLLDEACRGDKFIRSEVESLLAADATNDDFLNAPAYEFAAGMLAEEEAGLAVGQDIGRYQILGVLGEGGMGKVYLALNISLGKKVALKFLPPEFARDTNRVQRFEREARFASAPDHPNVCVVHEIGQTDDGSHFIAMEYVDGMSLRERLRLKRLTLKEALDVALQVAWALRAAHAVSVVHRDIKPENIMLSKGGYVKVLDFGIAKLNSQPRSAREQREVSTMAQLRTAPGMRIGTVKYMSPEQLREQPVDPRSDIWSLGVVLYEMVTGVTPFEAPTPNDIIALVLNKQPPEFAFGAEVPGEFQAVIRRALTKDLAGRYQSVNDLAADLRNLRRELRRLSELHAAAASELLTQPTLNLDPVNSKEQTVPVNRNGSIFFRIKSQAVLTADFLLSEIREHKKTVIFSGATAMLLLLFLAPKMAPRVSRFFHLTNENQQSTSSLQVMKITPLTNSGNSVCAAISPDGKLFAHAEEKDGMQQLLVTGIVTHGTSIVVPAAPVHYRSVTFSRDGNYLYFTRIEKNDAGILYQLALPGSAPRKIKEGVDSPITFSPSGDRFSWVRFNRAGGEYSLMLANVDGSEERTIANRRDGNRLSLGGPAWSPDGKIIVCGAGWWDKGYRMNLIQVDVEAGREKALGGSHWFSIQQVAWEDKASLILSLKEQPLSPTQLWRISYPQGELTRITNDRTYYDGVGLSSDGKTIVSVQSHRAAQIWVAPDGDSLRAKSIVSTVGLSYGLSWTNKGKLVFSSMAQDRLNISLIDPDGGNQIQLTVNGGDNYTPAASPDGHFIVFASNRTGSFNIWRMNADDGSDLKQLTFSDGNSYPSFLPDGQSLVYDNQDSAKPTVWRLPIEGGEPVKLTDQYARMPVVSPDNQFIACRYYVEEGLRGIAILPVQGGAPIKLLPIPVMDWQRVQWLANGRALSYLKTVNGTSNLWSYDLDSGSAKQLTDFKEERIFSYSWSPDYKLLACERGLEVRDVTMIRLPK
ncbi:MAG: protein kinase [bacterium]